MKVGFTDSFFESIKTIVRHETWWYKTYETIRYKIPMFLKNIWFFRKNLWEFRGWDYSFNLSLFAKSLEKTSDVLKNGHEIDITRLKKVEKIKRVIQLINEMRESSYISRAESELGDLILHDWGFVQVEGGGYQLIDKETPEEKEHNRKVYDRAREIEEKEFNEIWSLLKGQDIEEYRKLYDSQTEEEKRERELWNEWFDGSGIKHWWD